MKRPRHLTADERALWDSVAKQAKPLRVRRKTKIKVPPSPDLSPSQEREERRRAAAASPPPILHGGPRRELALKGSGVGGASLKDSKQSVATRSPPISGIERREKSRLARGVREIDARIDLHGMTQARAHRALLSFLHRAQADGWRYVLVITGKGKASPDGHERGVLRRQVPEWFALAEFRVLVSGYEEAAIGHGGVGALYVRVRRG